ncbi:MAG: dihydropteroate synthase, partial [Natronomonas sp.]
GQPILVSINRKNFLRSIAGRDTEEALPVSLAATSMAVERGAHIIRTHDVAETRDAALVGDAFTPERTSATIDGIDVEELDVQSVGDAQRYVGDSDGETAEAGVTVACELCGLDDETRQKLREAGGDTGVVVVGNNPVFVAGSVKSVRTLADEVADDDRLTRALTAVVEGSR